MKATVKLYVSVITKIRDSEQGAGELFSKLWDMLQGMPDWSAIEALAVKNSYCVRGYIHHTAGSTTGAKKIFTGIKPYPFCCIIRLNDWIYKPERHLYKRMTGALDNWAVDIAPAGEGEVPISSPVEAIKQVGWENRTSFLDYIIHRDEGDPSQKVEFVLMKMAL